MGNFNVNTLTDNHGVHKDRFSDILCEYFKLIENPTRITKKSKSLIDNIFRSLHNVYIDIQDYSIYVQQKKNITSKEEICDKNMSTFRNVLKGITWNDMYLESALKQLLIFFITVSSQHSKNISSETY